MAEIDSAQAQETAQKKPTTFSFSIWPPTQRTRDAVVKSLIDTLSSPSILSKRYGTVPHDVASETAKKIEEEAFLAVGSNVNGDDDGIEVLQVYSKEISKRMLETVKSRSAESEPLAESESKPAEVPADASEPSTASGTEESIAVETES